VYTTNKNVIETGRRLENLFWRILGSQRLSQNISGHVVASIFMMISEGEKSIKDERFKIPPRKAFVYRTACPPTPPPSPLTVSRNSPQNHYEHQYEHNLPSHTALSSTLLCVLPEPPASPPNLPLVPPPSPATPVIRPGLPHCNQSYPQDWTEPSFKGIKSSQQSDSNRGKGKTTTFASNTKPGAVVQKDATRSRKNDSGSSSSSSSTLGSTDPSPDTRQAATVRELARSVPHQQEKQATPTSDCSAKSSKSESALKKSKSKESKNTADQWLVEPDFRVKFQKRKENFDILTRKSASPEQTKCKPTVAVSPMTALSMNEGRAGKPKGRNVVVVDTVAPLKDPDLVPEVFPSIGGAGVPIISSADYEKTFLPRTKSQLTMLFEKDARKEMEEHGISPLEEPVDLGLSPSASITESPMPLSQPSGASTIMEPNDDGFEDIDSTDDDALEMKRNPTPRLKGRLRKGKGKARR